MKFWLRFWDDRANDPPIWLVLAYILTPVTIIGIIAVAIIWAAVKR